MLDRDRRPIGPPQSWTTTVASRRSRSVSSVRGELGVAVVGVPIEVGRLVGAAEAGVIGRDAAVARVAHRRDHLAPQVRPGRLAVEEDHRPPLPLVEVGQPQPVHLAVMRLEREVGEAVEALVGCPEDVAHAAAILCEAASRRRLAIAAAVCASPPPERPRSSAKLAPRDLHDSPTGDAQAPGRERGRARRPPPSRGTRGRRVGDQAPGRARQSRTRSNGRRFVGSALTSGRGRPLLGEKCEEALLQLAARDPRADAAVLQDRPGHSHAPPARMTGNQGSEVAPDRQAAAPRPR